MSTNPHNKKRYKYLLLSRYFADQSPDHGCERAKVSNFCSGYTHTYWGVVCIYLRVAVTILVKMETRLKIVLQAMLTVLTSMWLPL